MYLFEFLPTTLFHTLFVLDPSPINDNGTVIRVAREIAAALEYLHTAAPRRIVHHDLKPENVMLTDTLQAKLIDFGLASTVATYLTSKAGLSAAASYGGGGTLGYMPPEKLELKHMGSDAALRATLSRKVDVYSYGVILWQLATKKIPFADVPHADHLRALVKSGAPLPSHPSLTPALAVLVEACRALDPAQRPDIAVVSTCLQACQHPDTGPDVITRIVSKSLAASPRQVRSRAGSRAAMVWRTVFSIVTTVLWHRI